MSRNTQWRSIVALTAIVFAILIQVPQLLHTIDTRYGGMPVRMNGDEEVYHARVQEALSGRPAQAAEAFIGDPRLIGSQFAFLEQVYGTLFLWTGWRAPLVLQFMDSVVVFGLFLSLLWFFRQCGFARLLSYGGAVFFILLQLNNLNRPVHPGGSFLLMLTSLNLLLAGMQGRMILGIIGGVILGTLVGVYVWSWTFAWAWWGIFLVWEVCVWERVTRPNDPVRPPGQWSVRTGIGRGVRGYHERRYLLLFSGIALISASPFLWQLYRVMQHPLYEEAVFRGGMFPSRWPESIPYSVLFAGMMASVLGALVWRWKGLRNYCPAFITVFTAFLVMHQQVIHGITFNFVSHYLLGLILAAMCVLLLSVQVREKLLLPAALCAAIYLGAVGYDGRWVMKQFSVDPWDFGDQYLTSSLPLLDTLERQTILTDPWRAFFLAGYTKHDVVYAVYLKNVLISHTEIAERHCLTLLPLPPAERRLEEQKLLIYPDAVRAFRNDPSVREREVVMVKEACSRVDRDPQAYLKKYGVTYVFWDEQGQPQWNLKLLRVPLRKIEQGEGWSLWELTYTK